MANQILEAIKNGRSIIQFEKTLVEEKRFGPFKSGTMSADVDNGWIFKAFRTGSNCWICYGVVFI